MYQRGINCDIIVMFHKMIYPTLDGSYTVIHEAGSKESTTLEVIRISVRNLVEFILRSGDIDNRRGAMADKDAMQLGSRLHRKIQGQMGMNYRAEVPLKYMVELSDFCISVEGRADGILTEEDGVTIDEIKGVCRDLEFIKEPVEVHLAQAMCYAYIYGAQEKLQKITVQMTYCNLDTEAIKRFEKEYEFDELAEWFDKLIAEYQKWAWFQKNWRSIRRESIQKITFPYEYRVGQKDLAGAVYRTIQRKKNLFIQASTGVGKTISTVFPAVKAVGEGLGDKIFYLTAKTITRTVAAEAFELLKSQGLSYKVITLTAKDKICPLEEALCNPHDCPYAKGHYDRINDAVYELLTTESRFTREDIQRHSEKWKVCPFEFSLDLSIWTDVIICDYNYVFDPRARLKRFFAEGMKGDYIFLIDEAHNLVERGREMFSTSLYKEDFLAAKKIIKPYSRVLERHLEKCNKIMLELKRECEDYVILENVGAISVALMNLIAEMEKFFEINDNLEISKQLMDLYFSIRAFLDIHEKLDDNYVIYTELEPDGRFKMKLFCIDTSRNLQECLNRGNSSVFFSATLLPIHYYMELFSMLKDNYAVYAQSTFDSRNKKVLIGNDISSKYTRRGLAEYRRMAEYIRTAVGTRAGNYLVFFPSYKLMEEVEHLFLEIKTEDTVCMCQSSRMGEEERESFLAEFDKEHQGSLIGFCVMGGIFSEGIDLKYDSLIGALIIGTGLPQICNEREILKKYYEQRRLDGFAYAYLYPGMNKVLQAAGRVIRTDQDKGVILLLDDRFLQNQYQGLFPREWEAHEVCSLRNVETKLMGFWQGE